MTSEDLSILIVDEDRVRATIIEDGLREAGHQRVTVINSTQEVARRIVEIAPDVVVIDLENPDRDRLEHFFTLSKALQRPVAMFVDKSDAAAIGAAIEAGVSAYVVDGLRKDRVKSILDMAVLRFNAYSRLQRELDEARTALEDRKLIDKAKAILMKQRAAVGSRRLQSAAQDRDEPEPAHRRYRAKPDHRRRPAGAMR